MKTSMIISTCVAVSVAIGISTSTPSLADSKKEEKAPSVDDLLIVGLSTNDQKKRELYLDRAIGLAEIETKEHPNDPKAWMDKSNALFALNRLKEAETAIDHSIKLNPKSADAHSSRGSTLIRSGRTEEGVAAFKKALELNPKQLNAIGGIAQATQTTNPRESREYWQKMIALNESLGIALPRVIQCCNALGDQQGALKARDQLFKLHKDGKLVAERYCCDRFLVGPRYVTAFEYFVPKGGHMTRYLFELYADESLDKRLYDYVVGEIPEDTKYGRDNKKIKPNEHMYSIDRANEKHETEQVDMMPGVELPSYEAVRKVVTSHITKTDKK